MRWIHIYTSMLCLLAVLFFSATGVTLNHPEWTLGGDAAPKKVMGTLKADTIVTGKVDWLKVVEQLRAEQPVRGKASDMRVDGEEGSLSFKAPGNVSDCFFNIKTREYNISLSNQGFIGLINDLHRGRDSGTAWGWLIDVSGAFLILVSVTGLGILFYLKKSRLAGFVVASIGIILVVVLAYAASR